MPKRTQTKRKATRSVWQEMFDQITTEMLADPRLTDEEKAQLLAELEKPDDERALIKIKGEPLSKTIIKMRGPRL
jgi:hypothetical protein